MKAVIFDFFGVICSEITPFVLPRYMSAEEAVAYKADIVEEADLGHLDLPQVLEMLAARTGASAAQLHAEFWAHVNINPEMVALIEEVKAKRRTALLSNAMNPFLRQVMAKHDLERLFDDIVISAEVGLTKPNPEIYALSVKRLGLAPQACVFTDDNQNNIAAAEGFGLKALLFTGVDKLKADLGALGVL
ncbi:putative hydrolase of the HAD superfamily [Rhizomicrobium palustre]|uniref:Putative hydrolase of the HAD superfamily n=1 Tax=Rhizomicrobium palustre TaxID=189966 RepID=A0A846N034_9PROT|nr:HAD family phosphatase [Rhizomicrobium palustre]NIK88711.1 putative hydrolase of the HAD superfamily [Rhizomicrobium palustre]